MNYKDGKWAKKILDLQHDDGSWGYFHTLPKDSKFPLITEKALIRLQILGFTFDDKAIKKTVKYMHDCLTGKTPFPDREEKFANWKIGRDFMLASWIRTFTLNDNVANDIASKWVDVISSGFRNNSFDIDLYTAAYRYVFKVKLIHTNLSILYLVSLLTNSLDKKNETAFFKHVLENDNGIYYVYDKKLIITPNHFQSKETSHYLRAIELLAKYDNPECKKQLKFVVNWLNENKIIKNEWDIGKESKDGINFPLSDSWRKDEDRIQDCTYRINKLLGYFGGIT